MFKSRYLLGSLLTFTLLFAPGAFAHDDEAEVEGQLQAVNTTSDPPTVTIAGVTLFVTSSTEIEIFGTDALLADLVAYVGSSAKAEAEYDPSTMVASEIELENEARAVGTVTGTGAASVTIAARGGSVTVLVDDDTEIHVHDVDVTEALGGDLSFLAGLRVRAEYNADTGVADEIEVLARFRAMSGVVTAVRPVEGEFDLLVRGMVITLEVVEDTRIRLQGRGGTSSGTLADVAVGSSARVQFAQLNGLFVALDVRARAAREQRFSGFITARDDVNQTITVTGSGNQTMTFAVTSQTQIRVDGQPATFADLQVGHHVVVRYVVTNSGNTAPRIDAHTR